MPRSIGSENWGRFITDNLAGNFSHTQSVCAKQVRDGVPLSGCGRLCWVFFQFVMREDNDNDNDNDTKRSPSNNVRGLALQA